MIARMEMDTKWILETRYDELFQIFKFGTEIID